MSILQPFNGECHTCLTYLLGFQHDVGIEFLCSTGLVKKGYSNNPDAYVIVKGEWNKFIYEQNISNITETISHTTVSKQVLVYKYWE